MQLHPSTIFHLQPASRTRIPRRDPAKVLQLSSLHPRAVRTELCVCSSCLQTTALIEGNHLYLRARPSPSQPAAVKLTIISRASITFSVVFVLLRFFNPFLSLLLLPPTLILFVHAYPPLPKHPRYPLSSPCHLFHHIRNFHRHLPFPKTPQLTPHL
ncbi:hypothetical protein F5X99DRAFT_62788 [Biscogniauxia marginata]|nr:hypothetical protein F5X99DRAFT_62788 [Biscogniauxia marginata]